LETSAHKSHRYISRYPEIFEKKSRLIVRKIRYMPNFVSIGLFARHLAAKNANFCHFWTSAFSGVTIWQQSQKVEHGCTTTNLPLSNGIKIVSVFQRLHGEIVRTNSDVKRDEQTDRQKNQRYWPSRRRVKSDPTKLGMVIEDLEHVLAPIKFLGSYA